MPNKCEVNRYTILRKADKIFTDLVLDFNFLGERINKSCIIKYGRVMGLIELMRDTQGDYLDEELDEFEEHVRTSDVVHYIKHTAITEVII